MAVVESMDDVGLIAPSRCRGWSRADLLVHVHLGLQELLVGIHAPSDDAADTDAATYWKGEVPTNDAAADELDAVRFVQRVALAYRRPTGIVGHMKATAAAVGQAAQTLAPGSLRFQGHVMTTGNFMAIWAVELCVHHLDLACTGDRPTPEVLALTRTTTESLAGAPFPQRWDDVHVALLGAGRVQATPDELAELREVALSLPVMS